MNSETGVTTVSFFTEEDGKIRLALTREFNHDNLGTIREGLTKDVPENTRYVFFSATEKDQDGKILGDPNESVRKHKAHFRRLLMEINFLEMNPSVSFVSPNRKFLPKEVCSKEYNVSQDLLRGNLSATMLECVLRYDSLICALAKLEKYTEKIDILAHLAILYTIGGTYLYDKTLTNPCLDWTSNLPGYSIQIMRELKEFRQLVHRLPHDGSSNYDFEMDAQSLDFRCLQTVLNDNEYSPTEMPLVCSYFPADLAYFAFWAFKRKDMADLKFPRHEINHTPIKNIAVFCAAIRHGGAERCAVILANHFVNRGYHVFFYANETPQGNDYKYSNRIVRRELPKRPHERRVKLRIQLAEDAIDTCIFIDHAEWLEKQDILTAYEMNLRTIAMEHSVFSYPLHQGEPSGMDERVGAYLAADAVTVLSHVDYEYWNSNGFDNIAFMPNPPTFDENTVQESEEKTSHTLIFVGRLTQDKGVFDAVQATAILKKKCKYPDVKLLLVGREGSPEEMEALTKRVQVFDLEDNVEFVGHTDDVSKYFRQAAIHLMPSRFEGYPMTMLEAKAHGIPTVMYDLPHVETAKAGCLKANMGDVTGLVNNIFDLFGNTEKLLDLGREAKASLKEFSQEVVFARWNLLFHYLETGEQRDELFARAGTPEETIHAQQIAMRELENAYKVAERHGNFLNKTYWDAIRHYMYSNPAMFALFAFLGKREGLRNWMNHFFEKIYRKRVVKKQNDPKWYNGNHGFPSYDDE